MLASLLQESLLTVSSTVKRHRLRCLSFIVRSINPKDVNVKADLKRKATIPHIFINTYFDLPINENFDLFLGVGIGASKLYEKMRARTKYHIYNMQIKYF